MRVIKFKEKLFLGLCLSVFCNACGISKPENLIDRNEQYSIPEDSTNEIEGEMLQNEMDDIRQTERHAFMLESNFVFIADIPKNWRYVLSPVYEYSGGWGSEDCRINFIGIGEDEGENNFFEITVKEGEGYLYYDFSKITNPFVFQDGTMGEWIYQTGEGYSTTCSSKTIFANRYEGLVCDLEKKYNIHLLMLKQEYDVNEQEIKDFLASACFREKDLGIEDGTDIFERELLTLHIWDRYLNISVRVPEGAKFRKKESLNEDNYEMCSYRVYLDADEKKCIEIISDQGAEMLDSTGEYSYHLNTKDFTETVYEIPEKKGYYFPNHHLMISVWVGGEEEWQEYAKKIVQSVRFE